MIRSISQFLGALHGIDEGECVSGTAPVSVRFPELHRIVSSVSVSEMFGKFPLIPVVDKESQQKLTADGSGSILPVHQEHQDHTEDGRDQGNPLVVILNKDSFYNRIFRLTQLTQP